jgi:hypothetical protein
MTHTTRIALCAAILFGMVGLSNAETTTFGPSAYLQTGDTPSGFFCAECVGWIEDFELGTVDPFLTIDNGAILDPNSFSGLMNSVTDSVDGDDGSVDGQGNDGFSYFADSNSISISFARTVKNAGLVFTDGDRISTNIRLEAFDMGGNSLAAIDAGDLADDFFTGETAEDTFLGFQNTDGNIASITLTMTGGSGIEIDHVHWQEACAIPEPATGALALFAILGVAGLRKRR